MTERHAPPAGDPTHFACPALSSEQRAEVDALIADLITYYSPNGVVLAGLSDVPISWHFNPERANDFVRDRTHKLRSLLGSAMPADTRELLYRYRALISESRAAERQANLTQEQLEQECLEQERFVQEYRERETRKLEQLEQERLEQKRRDLESHEQKRREQERLQREESRRQRLQALRPYLESRLNRDFLSVTHDEMTRLAEDESVTLLESWRDDFIHKWIASQLSTHLDHDQTRAVGALQHNSLVVARAGSGKTRTLVSRAAFLVKHCRVAPEELMLLAFNKKAASEMATRLEKLGAPCPHVMTFHSLAYALVHPEQSLVYDDDNAEHFAQSKLLQQVINGFLEDASQQERVRHLMLDHFRADWENLIRKGLVGSMSEALAFRRSLVTETLRGEYVKSRAEQLIANFLFEHDIPYLYERNHWWQRRNYRPDFTLEGRRIVIEYFGLEGDPDYDEQIEEKRKYWSAKEDWTLLEYGPDLIRSGGGEELCARLRVDLEKLGLPVQRLSEETIWERIRDRTITRFASVLRNFVGRCRKVGCSRSGLVERLRGYTPSDDIESRFLDIASSAFSAYLERLQHEGLEDFDGLMERGAEMVERGETAFDRKSGAGDLARIRFVMVDEFQDMSPLFVRMLNAIRKRNPSVHLFGVGDDWQAINGFAGSDLRYFHGFSNSFAPAVRSKILTNYRSARRIVQLGNRIMSGRGDPANFQRNAADGRVVVADLAQFVPASEETSAWPSDQITPAVRRLIRKPLADGKTVALLARRDGIPYFVRLPPSRQDGLEALHRFWTMGLSKVQKDNVEVSTTHSFKGREADVVVVLDALERCYPLIHPDWVFSRVFGDTIPKLIEDDLRLFYVACTRAKDTLFLVTDSRRQSEFLENVRPMCETIDWSAYSPFVDQRRGWLLKVGSAARNGTSPTYERRNLLKAHGFAFARGEWPHWWSTIEDSLTLDEVRKYLQTAPWLVGPEGLEVRICSGDGIVIETLRVFGGNLRSLGEGSDG